MADLRRIVASIKADGGGTRASPVVTGDTKVVERGKGDGVYINTAGIGTRDVARALGPDKIQRGRRGAGQRAPAGDHGAAVMLARDGLLEGELQVRLRGAERARLGPAGERGGRARAARPDARRRGDDALRVCGERRSRHRARRGGDTRPAGRGRGLCAPGAGPRSTAPTRAKCLPSWRTGGRRGGAGDAPRAARRAKNAAIIGRVTAERPGKVVLKTYLGGTRILAKLTGAQLPRIC